MENDEIVETKILDTMYHRIQNRCLPCKNKSSFESDACEQLFSCDIAEDCCDNKSFPSFVASKRSSLNKSNLEDDADKIGERKTFSPFTMAEVIQYLNVHEKNNTRPIQEICGWLTCSTKHFDRILYNNIQDGDYNRKTKVWSNCLSPNVPNLKNPSTQRSHSAESSKRVRGSISKGSHTSVSSVAGKEDNLWCEPPPPIDISFLFKHYKYPRQYVIQYREKYTYKKLQEKMSSIKNLMTSASSIPKARLVCVDSRQGVRGLTLGSKSEYQERVVENFEQAIQEKKASKESSLKWNVFSRLNDRCDPTLSVNNPTPTEIATFAKMPTVRRSSPSIPSNSNGRFGFRGTPDGNYPFQLNISVGSCTISNPVRKEFHSVLTH